MNQLPPVPEFDEAAHAYTHRGMAYPSVTQVLAAVGMVGYSTVPAAIREAAMQRGSYAHEACELDDKGTLDESTLDERLAPYLAGWRAFKRDTGVVLLPEWVERRVVSLALGYAGTVDRVVRLPQDGVVDAVEATLDIKTGKCQRWTGVQLAAYDLARGITNAVRLAVELRKDGTYRLVRFEDRDDYAVWMAALKVYRFTANGRKA